jgi:hypothetical protein
VTLPADAVAWEGVRRLTFVPFLADGRCALLPAGDGLALPSGEVLAGEDPVLDTGLLVPATRSSWAAGTGGRRPRCAGSTGGSGWRRGRPPTPALRPSRGRRAGAGR